MRATIILVGTALAILAFQPALADHCTTYSTSATNLPEGNMIVVELDASAAWSTFYLINDVCQLDGCILSWWLYEESNGLPGLQRVDVVHSDTCHNAYPGDTIAA